MAMEPSQEDSKPPVETTRARITVSADPSELGGLRGRVVALARAADAPDDVIEAFELAVSELATNVIQHTAARQLTVLFERSAEGWILDVSNADALNDLSTPNALDPESLSGRGLYVVQAVMDAVDLIEVDGHQHIRCIKRS